MDESQKRNCGDFLSPEKHTCKAKAKRTVTNTGEAPDKTHLAGWQYYALKDDV